MTSAPPDLARGRLRDPALTAALRTLDLTVRRRLDGILQGDHRGLLPGPGAEPGEARVYVPGDDVRRIDWNVTARTTETHVRQSIADRELETWLVVDLSASLDVRSGTVAKRDLAIAAAAAMIVLTAQDGNRVGAVFDDGAIVRHVPARSGQAHAEALLRELATTPSVPERGEGALRRLLAALPPFQRRRGLTVLISDFLGEVNWEGELRRVAVRQDVLGVEILDPHDVELPVAGPVMLRDPETGVTRPFDLTEGLRIEYAAATAGHRAEVESVLRRCGAPRLSLRTDRDWVLDIARFVSTRRAPVGRP